MIQPPQNHFTLLMRRLLFFVLWIGLLSGLIPALSEAGKGGWRRLYGTPIDFLHVF
jgi:hypothetical protein